MSSPNFSVKYVPTTLSDADLRLSHTNYPILTTSSYSVLSSIGKYETENYQGEQKIILCIAQSTMHLYFADVADYDRAESVYNAKMEPKKFKDLPPEEKIMAIKLLKK
jgi:hypothetical protein